MQYKDMVTGARLTTDNELVIEQLKKNPDRYKEIKEKPKTEEKK